MAETPTFLKLYYQFGDSTSMHGIGRVLTKSSMWKRIVWSLTALLGLAFAVYQCVMTINDYYSYPVTTEVIMQHESIAKFPGVTICNLNMKRKSMIDEHIQDMMEEYDKTDRYDIYDILHELQHNNSKADDNQSGHQLSDMLINCWFNRYQCTKADFTKINTATFGACYTFKIADNLLQYTSRTGSQNGLILELNIEHDEYLPITSKVGVKVVVHPTDEYPLPEDGGILAQPGAVTSIEIKKVITHRLPAPYSACVDASGHRSTQRNLFPNKQYMQTACLRSCYQLALYDMCECCDTDVPCDYYNIFNVDKNITTNETVPQLDVCKPWDNFLCSEFIKDYFLLGELNCDELCPFHCDRTSFDTVVSSALWPSFSSVQVFMDYFNITVLQKSFADNASLERYIRSNFLRLEIFLDRLEFLEINTHAKYDWNLLLGTIGGQMGLWLGLSMLTTIEIVEVLIDTVLYCTRRKD